MLTAEQQEQRRKGIGSSDVAAVCGLSPYPDSTPHTVYLEKLGLASFGGNAATEIGDALEEPIARLAAEKLRATALVKCTRTYSVIGHEWRLATPDFYVTLPDSGARILEIKNVGFRSAFRWGPEHDGVNGVPVHVIAQVQWQMLVTGERFAMVAALIGGSEVRTYHVPYDADLAAALEERAKRFWTRHILARVPPSVDGSEGAASMVKALFPRHERAIRQATEAECALVEELRKAKATLAEHERRVELAKQRLKTSIGDAEAVLGADFKIRFKATKTGSRPFNFEDGRVE